jgi:hypothetical protein
VEHKTQADSLHFKGEKYLKRAEHVSGWLGRMCNFSLLAIQHWFKCFVIAFRRFACLSTVFQNVAKMLFMGAEKDK